MVSMFDPSDLTPPPVSQPATTRGSRESLGDCLVPGTGTGMSYQMLPGATLLGTKKLPGKTNKWELSTKKESTICEITTNAGGAN